MSFFYLEPFDGGLAGDQTANPVLAFVQFGIRKNEGRSLLRRRKIRIREWNQNDLTLLIHCSTARLLRCPIPSSRHLPRRAWSGCSLGLGVYLIVLTLPAAF